MSFVRAIAGLGNPSGYQQTRHNVGMDWLDWLARKYEFSWQKQGRTRCQAVSWLVADAPVWLVKSNSYMNQSGGPLTTFLRYHRIPSSHMLVVYDDITLPVGGYKISIGGSAGGHNGIRSLLSHSAEDFIRLRIGVGGKTVPEMDLADHVLGKFPPQQWDAVQQLFPTLEQIAQTLILAGPERAMNQFNKKFTI